MAKNNSGGRLAATLESRRDAILQAWWPRLLELVSRQGTIGQNELRQQSQQFVETLRSGLASGSPDIQSPAWNDARQFLAEVSESRARQGFTPRETALFIFSLKQPLFEQLRGECGSADELARELSAADALLDGLGLHTFEAYQTSREQLIVRQQEEMMELSVPVVQLWRGVLALPLIGTLDSRRTQVVMENLLQSIVNNEATIAIIDITGVPTVDTLVAQHLMRTVSAARLMGADCIISGIRPQIAQTIVHLGVDLGSVITKATLADAISLAFAKRGLVVVSRPAAGSASQPKDEVVDGGPSASAAPSALWPL